MVETIVRSKTRTLRFLAGQMTQEELARRVGVSRQTIIALEKGPYDPSVGLALCIARVFGVPVEEVFSLEDAAVEDDTGGDRRTAPRTGRQ